MFVGFDHEGEPVMVKDCRVVVEDSIFHTQKRNDIHNEQQNNINKNDEFIVKNLDRFVDWKKI